MFKDLANQLWQNLRYTFKFGPLSRMQKFEPGWEFTSPFNDICSKKYLKP